MGIWFTQQALQVDSTSHVDIWKWRHIDVIVDQNPTINGVGWLSVNKD